MYGASFTKAVFAYLVMQLVEEGVIDLDKPVYKYLEKPMPDYDKYKDLAGDDRYKLITARMLLAHTSGFPNWRWFNKDEKLDIKFTPGTKYSYSGEGINLLQFVIEIITKKEVGQMIEERIFKPFGMTRTSMTGKSVSRIITRLAMMKKKNLWGTGNEPAPALQVRWIRRFPIMRNSSRL